MTSRTSRFAVIVLAAGSGTRFSDRPADKLLAPLEGRPILAHVLAAVSSFGPAITVVVLGAAADAIESAIDWTTERLVRNLAPDDGIASSLHLGIDALARERIDIDGAFIVLGDQPRLVPETMRTLAAAAESAPRGRVLIVPEYAAEPGPHNPVLLLRAGWRLVGSLKGDRGLGQLIGAHPELVHAIWVPGGMPDVDHPEDLERLGSP